jgi:hypothetical protein
MDSALPTAYALRGNKEEKKRKKKKKKRGFIVQIIQERCRKILTHDITEYIVHEPLKGCRCVG